MFKADDYRLRIQALDGLLKEAGYALDIEHLRPRMEELEREQQNPDVWQDLERSTKIGREIASLRGKITAYEQGDKVAKEILAKCVKEWERLLMGVYKRFGEETCEITLIGGLTKRFDVLSQFLSAEITEKISFKSPEKPIVYGALRRAGLLAERTFLESYRS
jgi:N-acetylglucosamine kinase-like BadF-type ATPase